MAKTLQEIRAQMKRLVEDVTLTQRSPELYEFLNKYGDKIYDVKNTAYTLTEYWAKCQKDIPGAPWYFKPVGDSFTKEKESTDTWKFFCDYLKGIGNIDSVIKALDAANNDKIFSQLFDKNQFDKEEKRIIENAIRGANRNKKRIEEKEEFINKRKEEKSLTDEQKALLYKKIMSIDFEELRQNILKYPIPYFDYSITGGYGREYMGEFWGAPAYEDTYPEVDGTLNDIEIADDVIKILLKEKGIENPSAYHNSSDEPTYYKEMPLIEQDYIREVCSSEEFLNKVDATLENDWENISNKILEYEEENNNPYD